MNDEQYTLREPQFSYNAFFKPEKDLLRVKIRIFGIII